jgi:anti-sigma B factor antagonist
VTKKVQVPVTMDETSGLDMRIDRPEGATVVRLGGDLDLASCEWFRRAATDDLLQGLVILGLASVSFCDSAGLRVLLDLQRRANGRANGRVAGFRLAGPSAEVGRLLELSGADGCFDVFPDVAAALAVPAGRG